MHRLTHLLEFRGQNMQELFIESRFENKVRLVELSLSLPPSLSPPRALARHPDYCCRFHLAGVEIRQSIRAMS